tara:strand:- start:512 stop:724 length:213 start_codon:yes stop_codon:yes gene_type:complete
MIAIDDVGESKDAFMWCKEKLKVNSWCYNVGSNADYFYFNEDKDAQFFITVHGGRYCPPGPSGHYLGKVL